MAPLHIGHGSNVTNNSQSSNRQLPKTWFACLIALISACKVASCSFSRKLCPRPIISPFRTTTAPIGTSSLSYAFCASFKASLMNISFSFCSMILTSFIQKFQRFFSFND